MTNTGDVAGTDIVQAYIGYPNTAERRPAKELVGFEAVELEPGESRIVPFVIPAKDFSYFVEGGTWSAETVLHELHVAPNSDPNAENLLSGSFFVR